MGLSNLWHHLHHILILLYITNSFDTLCLFISNSPTSSTTIRHAPTIPSTLFSEHQNFFPVGLFNISLHHRPAPSHLPNRFALANPTLCIWTCIHMLSRLLYICINICVRIQHYQTLSSFNQPCPAIHLRSHKAYIFHLHANHISRTFNLHPPKYFPTGSPLLPYPPPTPTRPPWTPPPQVPPTTQSKAI